MTSRSGSTFTKSVSKILHEREPDEDSNLPPVICSNTREKIIGKNISVTELVDANEKKHVRGTSVDVITTPAPAHQLNPRYSLTIACAPSNLCFNLDSETVIKKLMVVNSCTHSIYMQCCGLWDSTAKLGASWKSYPRTRFLLAPGLMAVFAVRATPREHPSPLPSAHVALQLAASHVRDNVTGYFMVPIQVIFNSYIPPPKHGAE